MKVKDLIKIHKEKKNEFETLFNSYKSLCETYNINIYNINTCKIEFLVSLHHYIINKEKELINFLDSEIIMD